MIARKIALLFLTFASGIIFCFSMWERERQRKSIFYLVMAILMLLFSIALAFDVKVRIWM